MNLMEFIERSKVFGTLISDDRLKVLYDYCSNTSGEIWECGVYKGGSAYSLCGFNRVTRLFDTFTGMPKTSQFDNFHKIGDFNDVGDVEQKLSVIPNVFVYKGFIPDTFKGFEKCKIGFAHIDVDIYKSVLDCCEFIIPRLKKGGVAVFDDYGFETCHGAKKAVDEYFGAKIKILPTKQALYIK